MYFETRMKHFGLYCIYLYITLLSSSCVKEIPIISPQISDELIVNGIIKANEPIEITITKQIPISSISTIPIDSTSVILLSKNDIIVDTLRFSENRYSSDQIAIPGNQYSIQRINSDDVHLSAITIVPDRISNVICEFTAGRLFDEYGEPITESFITITDDEKEDDYYLLYLGEYSDSTFSTYSYAAYWQLNDPVLINEGILEYNPSYFVFSDELFQGEPYTLHLNYQVGYSYNGAGYFPIPAFCVIQRISKEYYFFMKSFLRHKYNQQYIDYSRFDPMELLLKGQPTELYTNIDNGLGIFASYTESLKEFEFIPIK